MYMCTRTIEIISMQLHCAMTNGVMRPHDMSWHCIYYTLGCEPNSWLRANLAANQCVQCSYCAQQSDYWQLDEKN